MPGTLLHENFSSLPIGSRDVPPNWTESFSETLIMQGIKKDTPTSHVIQITNGTLSNEGNLQGPPPSFVTFTFWFQITRNTSTPNLCSLDSYAIATGLIVPLISVVFENDRSLSIFINEIRVGNTGINDLYVYEEGWYWCQLNMNIGVDAITFELHYSDVQLGINGVKYIDTSLFHSGVFSTQVNQFVYGCTFYGALIGALQIAEVGLNFGETLPPPFYPNPNTTNLDALLSNACIEIAGFPPASAGRISQAVIEVTSKPIISNIRVSQAVIEIMTNNYTPTPPGGQGGWTVREV